MSISSPARTLLPEAPAVVAGHGRAAILTADGELFSGTAEQVAARLRALPPPLLVHAPATLRRLGLKALPCFDLLELFAFVLPARPAAPTPRGLALALDLDPPGAGLEDAAALLPEIALTLLNHLSAGRMLALNRDAAGLAAQMGTGGWGWAGFVTAALGRPDAAPSAEALKVWKRLPEWEDAAPLPAPSAFPVSEAEARARLAKILGAESEQRPGQADYAGAAAAAFAPREQSGDPHLVLAEAGTGTGKTLGYIAPASLWAERNKGAVWISTFTRHLQRQIDAELARLFPDPAERRRRVVVRKGRENYLCLLNLEDATASASGGFAAVRPDRVRPDRPLGDGDAGRRHPGRRSARLVRRTVRRRHAVFARRPPRRMHPRRLPALAALLRGTHHPPRPHRRAGRGQPRAGHGAGGLGRAGRQRGAHPLRVRRGASSVRCRRQRLFRRAFRHGDGRAAPLAAGRGGRPVARPRPAKAAGGTGGGSPVAGSAAGRGAAGGPRLAGAGLGRAAQRRGTGDHRPGCRKAEPDRGFPAVRPPPGAGADAGRWRSASAQPVCLRRAGMRPVPARRPACRKPPSISAARWRGSSSR